MFDETRWFFSIHTPGSQLSVGYSYSKAMPEALNEDWASFFHYPLVN